MAKKVSHLPEAKQEELDLIIRLLHEADVKYDLFILFGSYATGEYVDYDMRTDENGITTIYQSDYDLLLVISGGTKLAVESKVSKVREQYNFVLKDTRHTPLQFQIEYYSEVCNQINEGHYFYSDIAKEGIVLDHKKGKTLPVPKKNLTVQDKIKIVDKEVKKHYKNILHYYKVSKFAFGEGEYDEGGYSLHQTAEYLYKTLIVANTAYRPKTHELENLRDSAKRYAPRILEIFNENTPEDEECFRLLKAGYVSSRYDPDYHITEHQYQYLLQQLFQLKSIVDDSLSQLMSFYGLQFELK